MVASDRRNELTVLFDDAALSVALPKDATFAELAELLASLRRDRPRGPVAAQVRLAH